MSDDPNVFLRPSQSRDITEQMRMFDSKKWLWVPDEEEAFKAACVKSQKGDKMRVELADGSELDVEINSTQQMNPPKFEKVEDMAGLTYLNEASVLHNLRQRYYSSLIYTYSGLFCVAINPYRNLPIYTRKVVDMYRGKRKTEMPPHIFSVADNAYRDMLQDRENQSILITGESGAGKTENTKKVIQYFAVIAPSAHKSQDNLEDQVIQANPVLEAFGNAKTIRNDNSSRFGKFIRIHFGNQGKISGADIEYYLLEKSRVIHQQAGERCYHIFYQLMAGADQEMLNKLLLSRQVKSYQFLANSEVTVDNVDDSQMFKFTVDAMEILGIEKEEQMSMFRTLGGILHFGNIEVKQRPREEWATIPTTTEAEKVGHLLGISSTDLVKALIKPRIRVGNEYVQQGRNLSQVQYSIGALSKSLYERMFRWLVMRVNKTLDTKARKNFFIGVLDIAGFEIFKFNSFEQLCINFTNEKLQQFFNHHMFVLEQEEYRKEGIKWDFIDFGLDLQPCIDLIEKSMGILALLDEECLFPKASDKSFINKLHSNHEGKSPNYVKPQFRTGGNDWDFEIAHYAGTVGYNGTGWLDKNKDPLNESVVELMRKSTDPFIGALWSDYQTEGEKPRGKKGSQFVTMGQMHKTSLNKLMTTLRNTSPNFVRCIIPNEMKRPGVIDAHLVLHQLRCNGVLEGIRICRKGFPNRLLYQEFRQRYAILAPKAIPEGFMDGRKAAEKLISALQLESSEYRLGHSKVFFRAGVLGHLEDLRDQRLAVVLTQFQSYCRGFLMRRQYKKLLDQRIAIAVIQRNIRKHMFLRDWKWWKLYTKVKPLLNVARTEDELRQKEEEINRLKDKVTKEELTRKELEESSTSLMEEKNQLFMQLQREQDACAEAEENCQRLVEKKLILEQELQQMVDRLDEEVENNTNISSLKRKLEAEMDLLNEKVEDVNQQLDLVEQEKAQKEKECIQLDSELDKLNDNLSKSNKEKKGLEERLGEVTNCLQAEEDKANRLSKLKIKLESSVQEASDEIEKQKSARADLDKAKRKTEADLKTSQETVQNLTGSKADLEKTVVSKDKEIGQMQQKGEEDRSQIATLQRRIRELEARIEELEEDLENEKSLRNRTERQKNDLATELEQLQMKLEEEGDIKGAQIDLVRKRDTEINQFRKDYDSQAEEHDKAFSDMKKKHAAAIGEMEEQLEALQKAKAKLEKERSVSNSENTELQSHLDDFRKSKANADKKLKAMEEQLAESSSKNQEMEATIGSLTSERNKAQSESSDLSQQLGDAESKGGSLTKAKQALTSQVDDLKSELESETSAKLDAQSKLRQANAEIAQLQESLDEEQESKEALQRQLTASKNETTQLKSSLDTKDARVEELEEAKRKLQNQMKDCEEEIANAKSKFSNLEKTNRRIAAEVEDLTLNLEKMQTHTADLEKKQKKNDQLIAEWKEKHDGVVAERDSAMAEARNQSTEVLKLRNACEGLEDKLESVKKDKRNLDKEMEDLKRQLDEGGLSSHELEKAKAALEREKEELQESLEEAESEVEAEQAKVLRLQLELSQLRQDIERRLSEKDDENEAMRKNHQRQLEALQQSLDEETKAKNDNARMRKQAEAQCNELQGSIEAKDKAISDMTKKQRILQNQIKELNSMLEDEQRQRDEQRELASKAEKRANDFQLELEELRAKQEKIERTIRTLEGEKEDNEEKIGELTSSVTSLQGAKKRAEQSLASKVEEFEDMESELKETSDKCMKAVEQNNKLQSEVLSQKERIGTLEKSKTSLDHQVRDLTNRLDEEVENAKKNAKREIAKLQARIQELEVEVEAETKTKSDVQRSLKRTERRNKESQMLLEEEKSNSQRMQDQVNSLNTKVRNLRRDKEEAEGEVETMRNKMRQLRSSLEESEDRISDLETQVAKARAGARKTKVVSPMDSDEDK